MSQPVPPSAADWNTLFAVAVTIALIALGIVMGAMIYFTAKYREKKGQAKFIPQINLSKSRARDAIIFAAISTILLLSLAIASYRLTPNARFPPSGQSLTIDVTSFQWAFEFRYPNNVSTIDVVNVPANTNIIFNVTSTDVMHNFYLVEYRVSIDAIPGRYNIIWITTPSLDGNNQLNYTIRCKELCGSGHTYMTARLAVMDPTIFNQWLTNQTMATKATASITKTGA